mmetsp:Transcript_24880/g.74638  ORF Transcript_24880/g.74638 Transcript_24880/m.74638 type:complete len:122 (+) Transcript_24880:213-578(+)
MTTYEREMLSSHSTLAKFRGWVEGNESMLRVHPPRPNKLYATFEISSYVSYEKPGQYGDPEQTVARFAEDDLDIAFKTKIEELKDGDEVQLKWVHNYVTATGANGGISKYPERVITQLTKA